MPPSVTASGTGRSTVLDGIVKAVLLEEAVSPDMSDRRLFARESSARGVGLCGVDNERARTRPDSGAGSVATRRGTGAAASSLSSSSHTALMRRLPMVL